MPSLSLTKTAANGLAHDASHVNTPFTEVETWANTTKLDYLNVQDNGLRTSSLRTHAQVEAVRIKVRNATGSSIAANSLIYFNGTYSDGTNNYPTIAKAVSATSVGSTFFAQAVTTGAIADGADGTAAIFYELTGQNTSSGTVGDSVYLDTTAGGWTRTRPTGGQYVQVVGTITVVNASSGRVVLSLGSVPEHLTGGSSGLGATFQTLTVEGASGGAADIYHISDAGEDNADKWKISVADGGNMTWENYTSGSYAAKLTLTSAGAVTTAGALNIGSVSAAGEDTDKFLVLDSSSNVDYRTGAQVLSDIGAQASGTYTTLAYKTIAVSGQDNVVADAADDTLTLAAGSNVTLTTNASSDTVTIAASGGIDATNGASTRLATFSDSDTINGEANLTFTGSHLGVSGTMGIGSSVANATQGVGIHICTADADPDATVNASNDELIIEGNTSVGISLLTDDDGVARITWGHGSGTDAYSGQIGYYQSSDYMNFLTASTERLRIDANGRVGIGNSAPSTYSDLDANLVIGDTSDTSAGITIATGTSNYGQVAFTDSAATAYQGRMYYNHGNTTLGIVSEGNIILDPPNGSLTIDANGFTTIANSTSSTPYGLYLHGSGGNPNNTTVFFLKCESSTETKAFIYSNGDFDSRSNSYSGISDVKNKQNITDARNYWDDFAQVKFRKFKFKNDVTEYGDNAPSMLGVIAQEIETIFPNLVSESPDTKRQEVPILDSEGNDTGETEDVDVDLGTTTKSVKYSILNQIGLKVIQELQVRLEAAETKIAALEAA